MPNIVLNVVYNKNEGLILSPSDLITLYLDGIPLCLNDGTHLDMNTIKQKILASQTMIENLFSIKLNRQSYVETKDFLREDFKNWGHVKTTYPVNEAILLEGRFNDALQVTYPKQWLSIKKQNGESGIYRNIFVVPNSAGAAGAVGNQNSFIYSGISPNLGWFGADYIPNYWTITYITGWDKVPADLTDAIGKLAAIQILSILGDIILGVGISSSSLSLDGLSQSLSSTKSSTGGIFGGRIKSYSDQLVNELQNLKYAYKGITFSVM